MSSAQEMTKFRTISVVTGSADVLHDHVVPDPASSIMERWPPSITVACPARRNERGRRGFLDDRGSRSRCLPYLESVPVQDRASRASVRRRPRPARGLARACSRAGGAASGTLQPAERCNVGYWPSRPGFRGWSDRIDARRPHRSSCRTAVHVDRPRPEPELSARTPARSSENRLRAQNRWHPRQPLPLSRYSATPLHQRRRGRILAPSSSRRSQKL